MVKVKVTTVTEVKILSKEAVDLLLAGAEMTYVKGPDGGQVLIAHGDVVKQRAADSLHTTKRVRGGTRGNTTPRHIRELIAAAEDEHLGESEFLGVS